MNAKESLCTILGCLQELNQKIARSLLIDFVTGNETPAILQNNLHDHELFGVGDKHNEDHFFLVMEKAAEEKLIKITTSGDVMLTKKGLTWLHKTPNKAFVIGEDDQQEEPTAEAINKEEVLDVEKETLVTPAPEQQDHMGEHAKLRIQLIHAMDRKVPLDYFAEQCCVEFASVLDELEAMQDAGRKIDIRYFLNEVMDEDSQKEIFDVFSEMNGDIDCTTREVGDVYNNEEIRLAHLAWRAN